MAMAMAMAIGMMCALVPPARPGLMLTFSPPFILLFPFVPSFAFLPIPSLPFPFLSFPFPSFPWYSLAFSRVCVCVCEQHADIGPGLCKLLEDEFRWLMVKKEQNKSETRIRNVRFLAELTKFRVLPFASTFHVLKILLDDFTHHSIDALAALLETCGRYLYRTPETGGRMGNMLDVMMRLKNAKNLDPRQTTLVENAFYATKPPERSITQVEVPPLHLYVDYLLHARLSTGNVASVVKQCRKLPSEVMDGERGHFLNALLDVRNVKQSCIPALVSLVSGLAGFYDALAVDFIDAVLEGITRGLEWNDPTQYQQRVAYVMLLGEMYNTQLVDPAVVFQHLYLILYNVPSKDQRSTAPSELFRARLLVALLSRCGKALCRKATSRQLDVFLLRMQQFLLAQESLPYDLSYDIDELMTTLRPRMHVFDSFEQAERFMRDLHTEPAPPANVLLYQRKWLERERAKGDDAGGLGGAGMHSDRESSESEEEEEAVPPLAMGEETEDEDGMSEDDVDETASFAGDDAKARDGSATSSATSSVMGSDDEDEETSDTASDASDTISSDDDDEVGLAIDYAKNLAFLKPSEQEEEDLERAFQSMMQESLGAAKRAPKVANANLPAANKAILIRGRHAAPEAGDAHASTSAGAGMGGWEGGQHRGKQSRPNASGASPMYRAD